MEPRESLALELRATLWCISLGASFVTSTPVQSDFGMERALRGLAERGYQPAVIYDVGAADGAWTRLAATVWPNAKFVCFEPLQEREEALNGLAQDTTIPAESRARASAWENTIHASGTKE